MIDFDSHLKPNCAPYEPQNDQEARGVRRSIFRWHNRSNEQENHSSEGRIVGALDIDEAPL